MSDTQAPKWNPAIALQIINPYSAKIFCLGRSKNHGNARCRLTVEGSARARALNLLEEMSLKSPSDAHYFLPDLAQQLLCHEWHKNQKDDLVAEWTGVIEPIAAAYRHAESWKMKSEQLEQRLAERDDEINKVNSKNARYVAKYERLKEDINTSTLQQQEEVNELKSTVAAASKRHEDAEAQLSAERQRSQRLEALLAESENTNKNLSAKMEDGQQEIKKAQAEATQWKAEAQNQATALKAAQADLEAQREAVKQFQGQVDEANVRQIELAERLDKSQNNLEATRLALASSGNTIEKLRTDAEALIVAHSTEKSQLQQRIHLLETELSRTFQTVVRRWIMRYLVDGSAAMKRFLMHWRRLISWLLQFVSYKGVMKG